MRILHVAYIYPPILEVADGITKGVYNTTRELARRGHQVRVYTSNLLDLHGKASLYAGSFIINGIEVHYFRSLRLHKTFIITPSMILLLLGTMDNFDIIHIHDCRSFQGIVAYLFARIRKVPFVFQPHGSYLSPLLGSRAKKMARIALDKVISEGIVRKASKVIVLSRAEAEDYRAMGVPEEKIAIIPNGIDLESFRDLPSRGDFRSKLSTGEDNKIILFLGRIHKIKGIDFLVKAYVRLLDKFNSVSLAIVGSDDGYLSELKQLLSKMKMITNSVLLTGPLYGRDKLEAYVDADVFVLPSRYETFPNVVLEAYACSKPVIASNVESISDIVIHGKTGLLFSPGDVQELAKMISYMLTHSEQAEEMGHRARKLVEDEFSIERVVDSLEDLYEKVLEEKLAGQKYGQQ